jgi:3D (Asp-Asp-Asp) domain-containing protein
MKNVLATIVGFIVASVTVYVFESLLGHTLFPLPEGIDPMDMESIKENMHLIPVGAKVFVIIAHFMGILMGMFVAALISKTSMVPAYIVGGLMLAATTFNLIMLPKETWFVATDTVGAILGFYFGRTTALKKITSH